MKQITILGATGSIGKSTLDVIERHPGRYAVYALSAHRRLLELQRLCERFKPRYAVVSRDVDRASLQAELKRNGCHTEVLAGRSALSTVASAPAVDAVMAAIVGAAGLASALAAAAAGKSVLLANKEALVMAGDVFLAAVNSGSATLLPIDSEHNAVFQCLPESGQLACGQLGYRDDRITRIVLTASGGPFRTWTSAQMKAATPEQACAHPKWSMGRKISVDSATLMNKGLELIEAHYMFGLPREQLDVIVHPQSIVHSMVEYRDGSTLAQLGNPDMRTPIAHAMAYPNRIDSGVKSLSLADIGKLEFEPPDLQRFPCLELALEALQAEGAAPCVLNAANEVAVESFLTGKIGFADIAAINRLVLDKVGHLPAALDINAIESLDAQARQLAMARVSELKD